MLESKLEEIVFKVLGDKIIDEDEKRKISEGLHSLEKDLDGDISRILRGLRGHLDSVSNRFSSSDKDGIVKKVGENIARSEYTGI
jgi:hypothetical protein